MPSRQGTCRTVSGDSQGGREEVSVAIRPTAESIKDHRLIPPSRKIVCPVM
jgi:hypothetical protein